MLTAVRLPSTLTDLEPNSFNSSLVAEADLSACTGLASLSGFGSCHRLRTLLLPAGLQVLSGAYGPVETVTLPYERRPPKGWYGAWQNQFYLYDILGWMGGRMKADDALLVCDADCLCRTPLDGLFDEIRKQGSALYEFITDRSATINGITLPEMEAFYTDCYGTPPRSPLAYYGGEFIGLRGDSVCRINEVYAGLWAFNLARAGSREPKLNEEAHVLSVLAERLDLRNAVANRYVKRMWTSPQFNNVCPEDERLAVWHLPYEKKRGLYRLFRLLEKQKGLGDEERFWHRAKELTGVPAVSLRKRLRDRWTTLLMWFTRI